MVSPLGVDFFARPAREVAPDLIGCVLVGSDVAGVIVEVERYEHWDAASHSFRGPTPRSHVMFGPAGLLYVYRSYGLHWCANIVCGSPGQGSAVLLRAAEPTGGLGVMGERRGMTVARDLCRGPGRLAAAFGITGALNGAPLDDGSRAGGLRVLPRLHDDIVVARGPRIGITRDAGRPWRYALAGSPWVSGRRVRAATPDHRVAA
jgi:DNA-3-methyladenine glycosylase